MTVFECVSNSLKNNILFIGPDGYGKSTQLINCYKKIIEAKSAVVPIYIDLSDKAVISACRNGGMFSYILSEYCGFAGDLSNGVFQLKEIFKKENGYSFVILIDHFESAVKNEIYDTVFCDISELSGFKNCCVAAASTYYDERIFHAFQKYDFLPLPQKDVVSYIESKGTLAVTEKSITEIHFNVLTIPQWIYEYGEMLAHGEVDLLTVFESDVDLLTKKFDYRIDEFLDVFKLTCELAFYCVKNKSVTVPHSELVLRFNNEDIPISKRFFIAVKHLMTGKKEEPLEKFNRMAKEYGYGQLCSGGEIYDKSYFVFTKQMYIDYFAAEYCYNLLSGCDEIPGKLEDLNRFLLNDEVARMVALKIKKSERREIIINTLDRVATFNKNLYEGEMPSLENSKFLYLTANLLNINFYVNRSFENTNFSYLDLRLCDFIGKNCSCADFTKSFVSDECFVPVEPENASVFSVSDNGKFLVSGDKTVLNIRSIDYPVVIDSVLCENEDEFVKVKFINETTFEAVCKKRVIVVNITDETSHIRELKQVDMIHEERERADNSFSNYGLLCYLNEKYAVVKCSENSYYGQAYLLFDSETNKLIARFPFHSHLDIHAIVQRGDEINFLYPNSDKPLKAICYNEKTKEIYRKKYPSMIGRGIAYKDGKRIYFDTNKYDSYLKFYFFNLPTKQREAGWVDKENSAHYVINKSRYLHFNKCGVITDMFRYKIFDDLIVYDDKTDAALHWRSEYSKSTYDLGLDRIIKQCRDLTFGKDFNVIKIGNEYRLLVGNHVYRCWVERDSIKTNLLYGLELHLEEEYSIFIDAFPWEAVLKWLCESLDLIQIVSYDFLKEILLPLTETCFMRVVSDTSCEYCDVWCGAITNYLQEMAKYYYFYKNEIPSKEEIASNYKNFCYNCDNGIVYFDGNSCRYMRYESDKIVETIYARGSLIADLPLGTHFIPYESFYNKSRYFILVNIHKDSLYNSAHAPRIPIYDLELFSARTDDMIGLSSVCKDILKKQTTIKTNNMIFTDEK